jgi:hypothetical protein
MARAKAKGVKIGRRALRLELRQKIAARAAKGETPYAIAKALGIGRHAAAEMEARAILSLPGANGCDPEDLVKAECSERQASRDDGSANGPFQEEAAR